MPSRRIFTVLIDHKLHKARECNYHPVGDGWFCSCPVCNGEPANIQVEIIQYGLDRTAAVTLMECMQCNTEWFSEMVWIDGIPQPEHTPITKRQ